MSHAKPVHRGAPMLTLDPQRLARAGSVQRVSFTGRRRVGLRAVVFLLFVCLVLLSVVIAITLSGAGLRVSVAQTIGEPVCYISAPVLPAQDVLNCIQPRAFVPIMARAP